MYIPELNQISKLYHGTYCAFDTPSLDFSQPFRDFGRGFYMTTDFSQAQDFAMIKSRR
ncbi:MAG: DUF3990 domain-containing protein, partial [Coriobacteriales bacterium]|nr:DUF3990 domain-containing protein [Coriobacteriales bacterium]